MAMRLQELHPSLAHYPIAFLPLAVGADTLGKVTGSRTLLQMGRWGIALTAATGAVTGIAGLIAQEEVELDDEALDMLITHRTLNIGLVGIATAMTVVRMRRNKPSLRYLLTGLAGVGTLFYSAYLGGKMVYGKGVGVEAAGGIQPGHGPELTRDRMGEVARHALDDVRQGLRTTASEYASGEFVPMLTRAGKGTEGEREFGRERTPTGGMEPTGTGGGEFGRGEFGAEGELGTRTGAGTGRGTQTGAGARRGQGGEARPRPGTPPDEEVGPAV